MDFRIIFWIQKEGIWWLLLITMNIFIYSLYLYLIFSKYKKLFQKLFDFKT